VSNFSDLFWQEQVHSDEVMKTNHSEFRFIYKM